VAGRGKTLEEGDELLGLKLNVVVVEFCLYNLISLGGKMTTFLYCEGKNGDESQNGGEGCKTL